MKARGAPRPAVVTADEPVGVAARALLAAQHGDFARELQAARAGKVEGVHQLRVATRRLRATLALFADALPARAREALERDLAEIGRAVGPVRDLDVLAEAIAKRG